MIHWALLLAGSIYVAVSVFSPDSGYMPIMTKVYIETNSESTNPLLLVKKFRWSIPPALFSQIRDRNFRLACKPVAILFDLMMI